MRTAKSRLLLICAIVLLLGAVPDGRADWNPGDAHKMHYPQLPNLNGWDIDFCDWFLADDWRCSESGWIDDIHVWTSWKGETSFPIRMIKVRIYDNGVSPGGYSIPGEQLNFPEWEFLPEEFTVRVYGEGQQGWYEPCEQLVLPNDHYSCWQVNINNITQLVANPVMQEQGQIYWLAIRFITESDGYHEIGWKTSVSQHFMDDAVWWYYEAGVPGEWRELRDPLTGESLDLAFVITGGAELDFGDAPDPTYPTKMASNGARHVIGGPWLGDRNDAPDPEADGQPDPNATGDDNDGNDDENGVDIQTVYQGEPENYVTVDVSGGGGYVTGWVDLDGNGQWHSVIDMVYGPTLLSNGSHTVPISIDKSAALGASFARFRISTERVGRPDGGAPDGEVEDYKIVIAQQDLGDCPDQYRTKYASNGARHVIDPKVHLGKRIDGEADGQPSAAADGDDSNKLDDEDGVTFTSTILPGSKADVSVEASVDGSLTAWLDFNADGDWDDPCEVIFVGEPLLAGTNNLQFDVPAGIDWGVTYARFRFVNAPVSLIFPYGKGGIGEVEDYRVYIGPLKVDNLKWSQPPIEIDPSSRTPIYCGWDQVSRVKQGPPFEFCAPLAADDYRCLGNMPVTSIHWWGSYVGWDGAEPPRPAPTGWSIFFYTNVPASGTTNYSQPGTFLHSIVVPADRVHIGRVGQDQFDTMSSDTCFQYTLYLEPDEYFRQGDFLDQTEGDVFWIAIQANYPLIDIAYPWGWKSRPWHWMDAAVRNKYVSGDPFPQCIWAPIDNPTSGFDLAFELDTDPAWVKWQQPHTGLRHWPHYEDEESMARSLPGAASVTVFDDWRCDEKHLPVTAAVWWGSYIGYPYRPCEGSLVLPPQKPDYFELSIWTDVPAGADPCIPFSHPGRQVWTYRADEYDEVLVGFDKHYRYTLPPYQAEGYEPVFRYSVRLPQENWFYQQDANNIYWFGVQAVYSGLIQPSYPWGWTNHEHVFNDNAVARTTQATWPPLLKWEELHDQTGASEDMSFVLFTEPCILTVGEIIGGNLITQDIYNLWLTLGKPQCWCCPCHSRVDSNCDCLLNASDVLNLRTAWPGLGGTYDPCVDSNNDGVINSVDVLALRAAWPGLGGPGCGGVPGCP